MNALTLPCTCNAGPDRAHFVPCDALLGEVEALARVHDAETKTCPGCAREFTGPGVFACGPYCSPSRHRCQGAFCLQSCIERSAELQETR